MKRHSETEGQAAAEAKASRTEERLPEVKTFPVTPIDTFNTDFPFFRKPAEVGHFSLDIDRKFYDNSHQLKYFNPPHTIHFDLSVGYSDFIARNEDAKERLDHLLMWVDAHRSRFTVSGGGSVENGQAAVGNSANSSLNTDFITWRGHLTKLLVTPYEAKEPWKMAATLFKGTIYISEVETPENYDRRKNMEDKHKEMCYWGHKFETYVTSLVSERGKRRSDPSTSSGQSSSADATSTKCVNNSEAYVSVVRSRLDRHSLVFGAEVDCCTKQETEEAPGNYIELKTSHAPHNHHQHWSFNRYKLLKWWAQSFLAGVPKIITGFRHHHSHVDKLQTYNTLEIPRLVEHEENTWNSSVCFNFLDKFLSWVKSVVVVDDPNKVYMFSFNTPFHNVTMEEFDNDEHKFLPDWYVKST